MTNESNLSDEDFAIASSLGWELDVSPSTEMRNGIWFRHGGTYELAHEDEVQNIVARQLGN